MRVTPPTPFRRPGRICRVFWPNAIRPGPSSAGFISIWRKTAAGCEIIRSEKVTGTKLEGRTELQILLTFLRRGDVLVVTRIDRLARSVCDLANIVKDLEARGVALQAVQQPIDTGSPAGRAFLQMLGVFAEFETSIRKERQLEGVASAKARGVYKGRKPKIKPDEVKSLKASGLTVSAIAKQLTISRQSVYRAL
jgi:DNA invertase Pin-like site-specific DNA recombinase